MKKLVSILILFLIIPLVLAANLKVKKTEINPTFIADVDEPAIFELEIENKDKSDVFRLYSLVEPNLETENFFFISAGDKKTINLEIVPHYKTLENVRGNYVFEYQIKGQETGFYFDRIKINIIDLKDAFEFEIPDISSSDEEIFLEVKNKINSDFKDLSIKISSELFEFEEVIDLGPTETKILRIPLVSDYINSLNAGSYQIYLGLSYKTSDAEIIRSTKILEKGGVSVLEEKNGFIIKKISTTKTNQGNAPINTEIKQTQNRFTRLFTTYSERPLSSNVEGFQVENQWQKQLAPKESFVVTSTTNYALPVVVIVLIIVVVMLVKIYLTRSLSFSKRVAPVKTKGGEFALKITLKVKALKNLEDVKILDKLPASTKLYDKFGKKPHNIDQKTRVLTWNLSHIDKGEERIFSYIIYSTIRIVGKYDLPIAKATYFLNGERKEVFANKTSFISDSTEKPKD